MSHAIGYDPFLILMSRLRSYSAASLAPKANSIRNNPPFRMVD